MNDEILIERLLYSGEGDTLDFKLQQYEFEQADDEKKSVLLKDILAFANAWRSTEAHILIGVRDESREIVGLDKDIDDSRLQQFINGKTNRPLRFSYRSIDFDGTTFGLYTIPIQERPIYAIKSFGKVKADTVYVRRGSSTAEAKPDEIAKMGAAVEIRSHSPRLNVQVVGLGSDALPIATLEFEYTDWQLSDSYPDYHEQSNSFLGTAISLGQENYDYYRELASFIRERSGLIGFKLEVENTGDYFANDVKINLSMPAESNFKLSKKDDLLDKPKKRNFLSPRNLRNILAPAQQTLTLARQRSMVSANFLIGKIQSGEKILSQEIFLINPPENLTEMNITIFSDQLKSPLEIRIPMLIRATKKALTYEQIRLLLDQNQNQNNNQ